MIKNHLNISAPISPYSETDQYPTHYPKYGFGGYRSVESLTERNNIPELRREEGMLVYCREDQTWYVLLGGLSNDSWQNYSDIIKNSTSTGILIVSISEPPSPVVNMAWLNPDTGELKFRDFDNQEWKLLIATSVDGGSF